MQARQMPAVLAVRASSRELVRVASPAVSHTVQRAGDRHVLEKVHFSCVPPHKPDPIQQGAERRSRKERGRRSALVLSSASRKIVDGVPSVSQEMSGACRDNPDVRTYARPFGPPTSRSNLIRTLSRMAQPAKGHAVAHYVGTREQSELFDRPGLVSFDGLDADA